MKIILKKEKKNLINGLLFITLVVIITYSFIMAIVKHEENMYKETKGRIVNIYGDFVVISIDEENETKTFLEKSKESIGNKGDEITVFYNGYKNIMFEKPDLTIVYIFVLCIIIILYALYIKSYKKNVKLIKTGKQITANVVKNTPDIIILKWKNEEDGKTYYYVNNREINKNFVEKTETFDVFINPNNPKEFYIVV